jgi:hypothetical protein
MAGAVPERIRGRAHFTRQQHQPDGNTINEEFSRVSAGLKMSVS